MIELIRPTPHVPFRNVSEQYTDPDVFLQRDRMLERASARLAEAREECSRMMLKAGMTPERGWSMAERILVGNTGVYITVWPVPHPMENQ